MAGQVENCEILINKEKEKEGIFVMIFKVRVRLRVFMTEQSTGKNQQGVLVRSHYTHNKCQKRVQKKERQEKERKKRREYPAGSK